MPEAIEQAVEAIAKNLRAPTFVVGVGARTDSEIPKEVLREVVANAVVHREYDAQFLGESVTVDIYPDRWRCQILAVMGWGHAGHDRQRRVMLPQCDVDAAASSDTV